MADTKANSNISTEVIKEIFDGLMVLNENKQIFVAGIVKGMAMSNDIAAEKKGA
jgi:hypothetical protein